MLKAYVAHLTREAAGAGGSHVPGGDLAPMVAVGAADLVVLGASAAGPGGGEGALRPLHDHHALYERHHALYERGSSAPAQAAAVGGGGTPRGGLGAVVRVAVMRRADVAAAAADERFGRFGRGEALRPADLAAAQVNALGTIARPEERFHAALASLDAALGGTSGGGGGDSVDDALAVFLEECAAECQVRFGHPPLHWSSLLSSSFERRCGSSCAISATLRPQPGLSQRCLSSRPTTLLTRLARLGAFALLPTTTAQPRKRRASRRWPGPRASSTRARHRRRRWRRRARGRIPTTSPDASRPPRPSRRRRRCRRPHRWGHLRHPSGGTRRRLTRSRALWLGSTGRGSS